MTYISKIKNKLSSMLPLRAYEVMVKLQLGETSELIRVQVEANGKNHALIKAENELKNNLLIKSISLKRL